MMIDDEDIGADLPTAFKQYVDYLRKVPTLTIEQQEELQRLTQDPEEPEVSRKWARTRLWLDASKFVLYVFRELRNRGKIPYLRLDDMDAIQAANLAAGKALERWNPAKGKVTTWLYPAIRGALLDYATRELQAEGGQSLNDPEGSGELWSDLQTDDEEREGPATLLEGLTYEHHVFEDPEIQIAYGQVRRILITQHCQRSEEHPGCAPGWGDLAADFLIGDTNVRELAAKYGVSVPTVYNRMRKMGF